MPTANTREVAEATTHTVIIGAGLLDQEIAWRYDRAPLAPAAIDAERTILGAYVDAELDGDNVSTPQPQSKGKTEGFSHADLRPTGVLRPYWRGFARLVTNYHAVHYQPSVMGSNRNNNDRKAALGQPQD